MIRAVRKDEQRTELMISGKGDELTGDCGVICYLEFMKIEEENNK